jgi:Methyltransferase domain
VRFDEIWTLDAQLVLLGALAQSTTLLDGSVIEIGTWQGRSAIPIANAIAPAVLHVVDHWLGDEPEAVAAGRGIRPELVERDNYGIFLDNIAEATAGNVRVWKMGWREFAAQWTEPIRFLHLDATHTADEVSENIAALLPLFVPGGIFAGDDYDWPGVQEGVYRQFTREQVNVQFNKMWWVVV